MEEREERSVNAKSNIISILGYGIPGWIFYSSLTILFYGLLGVVAKFASNTIAPMQVQAISAFGMLPLILFLSISKKNKKVTGRLTAGTLFSVLVGLLSVVATIAQFFAYNLGGQASIVVPIVSLSSLVTVVFARFLFKDQLDLYQLFGVALSIIALVLFNSGDFDPHNFSLSEWNMMFSPWMLYALVALCSAGLANLFIKSSTNHVSSDLVTLVVLITIFLASMFFASDPSLNWNLAPKDYFICFIIGILGSCAFLAQTAAYSAGVTSLVAPLCSLFPVVTVILSAIVLGEKPTFLIITAVIVSTIAGIFISIEDKHGKS